MKKVDSTNEIEWKKFPNFYRVGLLDIKTNDIDICCNIIPDCIHTFGTNQWAYDCGCFYILQSRKPA